MLKKTLLVAILIASISLGFSCGDSAPTTTSNALLSSYDLRYRVIDAYPNYFWCDPDFYPIGSPGGELANALAQFDAIKGDDQEFSSIINRIGLDRKSDYTPEEKLLVYRQHKLLTDVMLDFESTNNGFIFVIRVGESQGQKITGTISNTGKISVTKTETSFNTCPICLSKGTLIDTPYGAVAVEQLTPGDLIWTLGENGEKVASPIIKTKATPAPSSFELLRITLADGRSVTASPGHPAVDGRLLGNLQPEDLLDGSGVVSIQRVGYEGRTYDILPAGTSGAYWANGILLGSTIVDPDCGC
ncbi:hypothetical protein Dform_01047 [Dehalogenimonas formicexedens]|uniref:Hedgehog/Intein (Hint) domain-containing protein n=1 Tax=Dehalogenimonas formicexedens TaxID=1839801 RepID=A0A1P8F7N3_9CHLR|nr:Hint domain-containing protein [Dehalogenimonas formicexedens]APV44382.1 hypothetical protein Dform_01047 [Dehalogenimonas formicexedens]